MIPDLQNLPWQIQASLASGYVAYVIAYAGSRARLQTIDTAFITLAFGLVATAALFLLADHPPAIRVPVAFVAACIAGGIWRKWGRQLVRFTLRVMDVSWSDDEPSALSTLSNNTRHRVTQVAVMLDDGRWLQCVDAAKFANAPNGPFLIGPNGDVALYLTHEDGPNGESKEQPSVRDEEYGDRITYVPASRIRCINIRQKRAA